PVAAAAIPAMSGPPPRKAPRSASMAPGTGPHPGTPAAPRRRNSCATTLMSPCRFAMARPTCSSASEMRAPEASASARASERARLNPLASPSSGTTTALILRATCEAPCEAPEDLRDLLRRLGRPRRCRTQGRVEILRTDAHASPEVRTKQMADGDRDASVAAALRLLAAIEQE